ncbi:MAG: type VI secretion system tube protein Hcp, partial [Gammaproteobacteria bacterium]|nr:type VI secretion system tube protein Hcp [Gammaproteobacteria bacterium]
LEEVSFTYRKIAWTHEAGGTQGMDDWRTPNR